jgi:hypothetical protein
VGFVEIKALIESSNLLFLSLNERRDGVNSSL